MKRSYQEERALLVGCHGGVGRAVQGLLGHSDRGRQLHDGLGRLVLVDQRPPDAAAILGGAELLDPTRIDTADDLGRLVREHRITQVVDLSSLDTVDCTRACDDLGCDYLCTSVEEWPAKGSIPTNEAIRRLLPPGRPALGRSSHLIGSGANPGIVNALVFAALHAFAEVVDVEPSTTALDLHSILITEEDTTSEPAGTRYAPGVFPMTWSPVHCLEELFETRTFAARSGVVVDLGHRPTSRLYRARCGDRVIEGMVVPHEETKTLAWRLPNLEIAFIYRIPEPSRLALAAAPERKAVEDWRVHPLYPPLTTRLLGRDRVGVLLCSRRFGELWLGFDTDVEQGLVFGTNATQIQVAAGVLAGWLQLGARLGIHFVEDLDWRQFLAVVSEILGPPIVVHDPGAPPLQLAQRALA